MKERAREYGWDTDAVGIMSIPDDPQVPTKFKSILESHGEIDIDTTRAFEESYVAGQSRSAQDAAALYRCLMNSISKEGKKKILVWEDQYQVDTYGSGNLLLKITIRESHLDTNATSASIRKKLTNLNRYLQTIGHDITKFNNYVKLLEDGLRSRGEATNDLLINLFKDYVACTDKEFIDYIRRKEDSFKEGAAITPDQLMQYADEKYKSLLQKRIWNAPDANEEKILALQVEINKLKNNKKKNKQSGNKNGDKNTKSGKKKKPNWFNQRPDENELSIPKEWNNATWYYCHKDTGGQCDGRWRQHKPSQCKGKAHQFFDSRKKTDEKKGTSKRKLSNDNDAKKKRALKLKESIRAASAVVKDSEGSTSSDKN